MSIFRHRDGAADWMTATITALGIVAAIAYVAIAWIEWAARANL